MTTNAMLSASCAILALGIVSSLAVFSSCALKPTSPVVRRTLDPAEEHWIELTEQISRQQREIAKLSAAVETLAENRKESPEPKKGWAEETGRDNAKRKVFRRAKNADWDEEPLSAKPGIGQTVADSSQESMHFYFHGLQMVRDKQYESAIKDFRTYLRMTPDHVYADRAEYWIAESYFRNQEYSLVLVATNKFESQYPHSFRLPDAMLKRALAYANLGQTKTAELSLRDLMKRFPGEPAAEVAARRLADLGSKAVMKSALKTPPLLNAFD